MIALIIVISFLLILFSLSITFRVNYSDELNITVGIGKLRFTLVPRPEKKTDKPKEKGDVKETVFMVIDIIKSVLPPLKDLLKRIRVTSLCVDITVSGEDAAQTAINYGKVNALVHSSLAALKNLVKLKVKKIKIDCDFLKTETEQRIFFKVKIRIIFVISAALRMGYAFLANTLKRKKMNKNQEV